MKQIKVLADNNFDDSIIINFAEISKDFGKPKVEKLHLKSVKAICE